MAIECIKKYVGYLYTIQKGQQFYVKSESQNKYCIQLNDHIGYVPKEYFRVIK